MVVKEYKGKILCDILGCKNNGEISIKYSKNSNELSSIKICKECAKNLIKELKVFVKEKENDGKAIKK